MLVTIFGMSLSHLRFVAVHNMECVSRRYDMNTNNKNKKNNTDTNNANNCYPKSSIFYLYFHLFLLDVIIKCFWCLHKFHASDCEHLVVRSYAGRCFRHWRRSRSRCRCLHYHHRFTYASLNNKRIRSTDAKSAQSIGIKLMVSQFAAHNLWSQSAQLNGRH